MYDLVLPKAYYKRAWRQGTVFVRKAIRQTPSLCPAAIPADSTGTLPHGYPVLPTLPFVCARDSTDYGHLMLFFQFGIDGER